MNYNYDFNDFQKYNNNLTNTLRNFSYNDNKQIDYAINKDMQ